MNRQPFIAVLTFALMCLLEHRQAEADTLVHLASGGTGQSVSPATTHETLQFLPSGGSFRIWVKPGVDLTGISLDLEESGGAIRFTDATVHNPTSGSDNRWLDDLIRHGDVTDDKISRIEGGALIGLTGFGRGIGPATTSSDGLYESDGGFLLATIDFAVANASASSTVSLVVGHNQLGDTDGAATDEIFFGTGDGPVANAFGARGTAIDLRLVARPLHPSDFNTDGDVGGGDFLRWQTGNGITSGATRAQGDANNDGAVNGIDEGIWESQYGTAPQAPIRAVPEPGSLSIVASLLLIWSASTRRSCHRRKA